MDRARLQSVLFFPRRLVWLGLTFGAMSVILSILARMPPTLGGKPSVAPTISAHLPVTLQLLGLASLRGMFLAAVIILLGVAVLWLRRRVLPLGAALQRLGQMGVALGIAIPPFVLGLYLLNRFALELRLLPLGGWADPTAGGSFDQRYTLLPTLTLSVLPAALVARSVLGEIVHYRGAPAGPLTLHLLLRFVRDGLIQGIGMLGGVLLVEAVFALPGVGRLTAQAAAMRNHALLFGLARSFLLGALLLRALADVVQGVDGFVRLKLPPPVEAPSPAGTAPRSRWWAWAWLAFCLLLVLVPLAQGLGGLLKGTEGVVQPDIAEANLPPGSQSATGEVYPWGTDLLGRDIHSRARYAQGALLFSSLLIMLAVLIPALVGGGLAGYLAGRGTWWADLLDDLVQFPAEVLSALPGLILLVVILSAVGSGLGLWLALAFLLPRGLRLVRGWWLASPPDALAWRRVAEIALGLLVLGTGWAVITQATLGFLGLGVQPPQPDLGSMVGEGMRFLLEYPHEALRPGGVLVGAALGWFLLADTLFSRFGFHRRGAWLELNR